MAILFVLRYLDVLLYHFIFTGCLENAQKKLGIKIPFPPSQEGGTKHK